jgi:signal transduction histidine kinase
MKPFKNPVQLKTFVALSLLWLMVLIPAAYLLRRYVVTSMYAGYQASLRSDLATAEHTLEHAFLTNDFQEIQKMVVGLSSQGHVHVMRLLNREGRILASSLPDEIGIRLDRTSQPCRDCHASETGPAFSSQRLRPDLGAGQVMVTARSLENRVACQTCHSTAGPTLGVLLAERDTAPVEMQASDLTLGIYGGAGALFLALAALSGWGFDRLLARPLRSLAEGHVNSSWAQRPDELGAVARRLQVLHAVATEKSDELDAQRRNFHALMSLSESIDVTLAAEKVLQFAASKVQEMTGFDATAMRLLEPDQKCFRLVAQLGMSARMVEDLHRVPVEIGFTGDVYKTHRAAFTSDLSNDPRLEAPSPVEVGYRSLVSVPFLSGERLMGTMELATKDVHQWTEDEIRWLELLGRSIGNVLHHIETANQLQGLAVMQERSRIAQEIHDGLVQLIGTLRLWAEEAQLALGEDDLRAVQTDLQKIELAARDAYASLREEILGLRDTISPEQGLLPVIREYLSRYQRQWGIEAQLVMQPISQDGHEWSRITPAAEIQLLRIIQESLTNVRRHANASRVVVSVQETEARLRVEISDNGQGFAPQAIPDDKLGLRIMRERAVSVGGRVEVESAGGAGTRLIVELPKQALPLQAPPWAAVAGRDV